MSANGQSAMGKASRRSLRMGWIGWGLVVPVILTLLAANQYVSQHRDDETDAWLFRYYGRQLVEGRTLYSELWDNKPPGIYWLNHFSAVWGTHSRWVEYVLGGSSILMVCFGLHKLARQITGEVVAGWLATLMGAVFVLHPFFLVGGNRAQTFVVLLEVWAATQYWSSVTRPVGRWRRLVACGALCGLAMTFLQTAVAVPIAVLVAETGRGLWPGKLAFRPVGSALSRTDRPMQRALFLVSGMLLTFAFVVLLLAVTSDLSAAFHAIIEFPLSCLAGGAGNPWRMSYELVGDAVAACWMPLIVAAAGVATWLTVGFRVVAGGASNPVVETELTQIEVEESHRGHLALLFLCAWLVVAVFIALLIPNRKWHYFAPVLAPLVLLAACTLGLFWKHRPQSWGGFPVWLVVVWMVAEMISPMRTHLEKLSTVYYWASQDREGGRASRMAETIQSYTRPDETLFVVGFDPQIYALANRRSASRFPGTFWAYQLPRGGQAIADQIMRDLSDRPPKVIVADPRELGELLSPQGLDGQVPHFMRLDTLLASYRQDPTTPQVWIFQGNQTQSANFPGPD